MLTLSVFFSYSLPSIRTMASTPAVAAPSNANAFLQAVEHRRTVYALGKESPIPDARIREIVEFAVKNCPVRVLVAVQGMDCRSLTAACHSPLSTRNRLAQFSFSARTTTSPSQSLSFGTPPVHTDQAAGRTGFGTSRRSRSRRSSPRTHGPHRKLA